MHPYILQMVAAERVRDMRKRAAASELIKLARSSQPGTPAGAVLLRAEGLSARGTLDGQASRPATAGRQTAASCPPAA